MNRRAGRGARGCRGRAAPGPSSRSPIASTSACSPDSRAPSARAIALGTSSASEMARARRGVRAARAAAPAATSSASRLFPAPPGPVIVTSRARLVSRGGAPRARALARVRRGDGEGRKARGRERLERRKVVSKSLRHELEELDRVRDVLQPVPTERPVRGASSGASPETSARRLRDDDLLAVRRRADARRDHHVDPDVSLGAELGLAGVQADPEMVDLVVGPRLGSERAVDLRRRGNPAPRALECEEDTVPRPVDLCAVVLPGGLPNQLAHACASRAEALAEQVQQAGRPLHVREEKRDGAGRQIRWRCHWASLGAECRDVHFPAVFDTLSDKLQATLGGLGRGGPPRRGGDLEGDARDPARSARGGRQPRGRAATSRAPSRSARSARTS